MTYNQTVLLRHFIGAVIFLLIIAAVIAIAIFIVKHLIKFTTRTIYEEKARAEDRHRQGYDPERDR